MINIDKLQEAGIVSIRDFLIGKQQQGEDVMRLESGGPSFDIPPHVEEAAIQAYRDKHTRYTEGAGITPLREKLYVKLLRENKLSLDSINDVLVTNGAMNALYITFRSIYDSNPNYAEAKWGSIAVPTPTWTETETNVKLAGFGVSNYISLDHLEMQLNDEFHDITGVVINSPHNPTGWVADEEYLKRLSSLADEHDLWIISDEAYEHILYNETKHISIGSLNSSDRVVSIFSFSKSYAMPGLRVGYMATKNKKLLRSMRAYLRCTINGVNSIAQHAALAALTGPQEYIGEMVNEYAKRRDILIDAVSRCSHLKLATNPDGAFYLWCKIDSSLKEQFFPYSLSWGVTAKLLEHNIGSSPGDVFGRGGKGYLRLAYSCPTNHIERAANILPLII